jgi:hypothetical protein
MAERKRPPTYARPVAGGDGMKPPKKAKPDAKRHQRRGPGVK